MTALKPWPAIRRPNRTLTPAIVRALLADIDPAAVAPTPRRRRSPTMRPRSAAKGRVAR